ncbi:MAG TPA: PLD nuclease N-terminal domain-containing protein [Chthoniobacterales bacterium]|nr:PLD nuclease N-terminal domain-containing protein [Chthoniobacterales bacterium]
MATGEKIGTATCRVVVAVVALATLMVAMIDAPFWPLSLTGELVVVATCVCVSLWIIAHLWITQRADSFVAKFAWSLLLLVFPIVGWLFYAAFYRPPKALYDGDHYESGLG